MQLNILIIFLVSTVIIIGVFIFIFRTSLQKRRSTGLKNALIKRFWIFIILSFTLVVLASVTIPKSPYYLFAKEIPTRVIHVAAKQFYFILSPKPFDSENSADQDSIEISVKELVEFRVRSLDVNHGFAIYNDENVLIAQTQAMPGYVNVLRWKFSLPGIYTIRCLEFCGSAHVAMSKKFTVND